MLHIIPTALAFEDVPRMCIHLGLFPERDDVLDFDLRALVEFNDGASIDCWFHDQHLGR